MSSSDEDADAGGLFGPSGVSKESAEAMLRIASHLALQASGPSGELKPSAEIQLALRDAKLRHALFEDLLREVCPNGADVRVWRPWLDGGPGPFAKKLSKTGPGEEKPHQTLKRSSDRVRSLRSKLDKQERALEETKEELAYVERYENAAVHYYVADHIVKLMEPVFAMGPAWTIMRSIGGHLSEAAADEATVFFHGKEKEAAVRQLQAERMAETEKMFETLDFFSGVLPFEDEMRSAVMDVCKRFDGRREEFVKDGRRPRGAERLRTEVHPKARDEAAEILDGLKPAS